MTPRVVRFDDEPAPASAAPVARFGPDTSDEARPAADPGPGPAGDPTAGEESDASAAMFDEFGAPVAAAVASVGDLTRNAHDPDAPGRSAAHQAPGDPGTSAPPSVVDIAGMGQSSAPAARTVELTGLGRGGRRRRGEAIPGGRDPVRGRSPRVTEPEATDPSGGTSAGPPDEESSGADEPRRSGRSGGRRGGGGFGNRGAPAELDPDADPIAVAKDVCLRLLTDRARTRQELAQALRRKGVPDDAAHTVLERFDEVGLIDDAAFAGQWVRSRHNHRGLARRAIAMELRRKGVDDDVAGEALEAVDQGSEERRARELVDRKLRTVPADTPEQRTKAATRLVGMLARKGYGGGIAYRVVREALAAHGAEIDELGTEPLD